MSAVRRWEALTRDEITELAPDALLVLPVGTIEQHGPHLATGTDALIVTSIAERAAAAAARPETILLAPTLAYGASDHHLPFGGTLSLGISTFQLVLADLLASVAAAGCRRVFVLNGHGGNAAACSIAVAEASREHGLLAATALASDLVDPADVEGPKRGHAGSFETSLVLVLDGDRVRPERASPSPGGSARSRARGLVVGEPGRWQELNGFTDRPDEATVARGERALAACVAAAARAFEEVAGIGV
jgi:creatinine amidohydrolase